MNNFGRLFRIEIYGESHGPEIGVIVDGCPAGIPLLREDFLSDLLRRKSGRAGTTDRLEEDDPEIISGVFSGKTTGAPILIRFRNQNTRSDDYEAFRATPRPGQADFTALKKFGGYHDHRGGGAFSGRLTLGLVAAGVAAKKIIAPVEIAAELIEAGGVPDIETAVERAVEAKNSIGGVVECRAAGVPAGLGEPFFDSLESLLSHLLFAIPGIKGVEFGSGFQAARMRGSEYNDPFVDASGTTRTNHCGGINGGLSNGNPIVFRTAVRPAASIPQPQETIDLTTGRPTEIRIAGRHDACFALRVPVVVEAALAVVLADLFLLEQKRPRVWPRIEDKTC